MSIPEIEMNNVQKTYEEIATHFSDTRYSVWNWVKDFLAEQKSPKSQKLGIEIGCGNGKNIYYAKKELGLDIHGIDNSHKFVKICNDKGLEVKLIKDCADLRDDITNNMYDFAFSVAVFHHLSTKERQISAINEMIRILCNDGVGIFSVWSVENQTKRKFREGVNMIKWERKSDGKIFERFYFVFTKKYLQDLMNNFENIENIKIWNEMGNWVVQFNKKFTS